MHDHKQRIATLQQRRLLTSAVKVTDDRLSALVFAKPENYAPFAGVVLSSVDRIPYSVTTIGIFPIHWNHVLERQTNVTDHAYPEQEAKLSLG